MSGRDGLFHEEKVVPRAIRPLSVITMLRGRFCFLKEVRNMTDSDINIIDEYYQKNTNTNNHDPHPCG